MHFDALVACPFLFGKMLVTTGLMPSTICLLNVSDFTRSLNISQQALGELAWIFVMVGECFIYSVGQLEKYF